MSSGGSNLGSLAFSYNVYNHTCADFLNTVWFFTSNMATARRTATSTHDGASFDVQGPTTTAQMGECFASSYQAVREDYYSPATWCPAGYDTATSTIVKSGTSVTETRATCCPPDFSYNPVTVYPWEFAMGCSSGFEDGANLTSVTVLSVDAAGSTSTITTMDGAGAINAFSVVIRWQATDLPVIDQVVQATPTSESSASPSATGHAGLSTALLAVIGIGVTIAVLVFAGLLGCAFVLGKRAGRHEEPRERERKTERKWKRMRDLDEELEDTVPMHDSWTRPLRDIRGLGDDGKPIELVSQEHLSTPELNGTSATQELSGYRENAELPVELGQKREAGSLARWD